ncbi:hypothetical protein A3J90_01880 [candidate division WOR-1 bacterium RIFOXYC2_FULL_37_10]|uniref:Uncharacterized protein n=1 Tax=candidate division WOR-1 bacterium RIFOXYB2_FULL_37_13 TaxID=1802579 RepID=A0A1F4SWE7_UNCSA|nr:MAG: hypothetical protein A2310_05685 [candidate division WOR-1 bacterium RIFOXYB2_FULL_37_13]OGC33908.1 MAG: hypothetical protein A3J90_01880 [candidate division WOR-1 bacterium RIFOXYC2_FULL_37_10]
MKFKYNLNYIIKKGVYPFYLLSLYEAAQILRSIPAINSAVNLDTGGGNVGGYADGENWQFFSSGHTARSVFYYKKLP